MKTIVYKNHYKDIIRLGVPIMLGQLGVIIVGFADTMMVGHHSLDELAASSFVNNFFNLAFIFGMGFSYGLTPIISGLFVNKKPQEAGETLKNSIAMNMVIGLLLCVIMTTLLFNIRYLRQPEELLPYIIPYYILQLFSIMFAMIFNSFKQFNEGITDTLTPMYIMLACNVLNIIGNYILIFGNFGAPELGLIGAGISTLCSRILTCLIFCILFFTRNRYKEYVNGFKKGVINRINIENLMRLGFPVGLQMGVESASFNLSVIMMGWLGSIALAAHQIVGVVTTIGFMIYYGIAAAVAIRVSGFRANDDLKNIRYVSFAGLHIIFLVACIVMGLIFIFRNQISFLFNSDPEVASLVAVLAFPVILYQIGDGLQILFANALRGIRDVKYMARWAFICHFGLALPIGYVMGIKLGFGPIGIWCGFPFSLTVLGMVLWKRFDILTLPPK